MAGKIFYRVRQRAQKGQKMPRYHVVAVSGVDMKVYGSHFRKVELKQIAKEVGAELVRLKRGKKHQ